MVRTTSTHKLLERMFFGIGCRVVRFGASGARRTRSRAAAKARQPAPTSPQSTSQPTTYIFGAACLIGPRGCDPDYTHLQIIVPPNITIIAFSAEIPGAQPRRRSLAVRARQLLLQPCVFKFCDDLVDRLERADQLWRLSLLNCAIGPWDLINRICFNINPYNLGHMVPCSNLSQR